MKAGLKRLLCKCIALVFALIGSVGLNITFAYAANSNLEMALRNFGDLSMFDQALLNTGVVNELNESTHYTVFAPVNNAFVEIPPQTYPCFYSAQCRPQVAELLRDHILVGRHELTELTNANGLQTTGAQWIHVDEPYLGNYTVDGHKILSESEVGGNVIYRIDGVIASPRHLAQFETMPTIIPAANTVTTEKTITKRTYRIPAGQGRYPAGGMIPPTVDQAGNADETTTVIETTTGPD